MKTKEELKSLKADVKALEEKLKDLSEDELAFVIGGAQKIDPDNPTQKRCSHQKVEPHTSCLTCNANVKCDDCYLRDRIGNKQYYYCSCFKTEFYVLVNE